MKEMGGVMENYTQEYGCWGGLVAGGQGQRVTVQQPTARREAVVKGMTRARRNVDRAQVVSLYKRHQNMQAVAELLEVTHNTVRYHLAEAGVEPVKPKLRKKREQQYSERLEQVRELLRKFGPMTAEEIHTELLQEGVRISRKTAENHIHRWRRIYGAEVMRVTRWIRGQGKPIPVYGLGPGGDAPFVQLTTAELCRRYRQKNAARLRALTRKKPATPWDGLLT